MQWRGYCFKSMQAIGKTPTQKRILRVPEKSLIMPNEIESFIKIYQFATPTVRSEAPKTVNAFEKLHALQQTSRSSMPNNYAWILPRLLSHGKVPLPSGYEAKNTAIPFWPGYQSLIAEKTITSHCGTNSSLDDKPSDMSTVAKKMHRNVTCTLSVIFSGNNRPAAVLYRKASCVAFTRRIQQPHYAIVASTHSVALFHQLVSSEVMVLYVIFSLMLVCMHLSPLIKCCLESNTNVLFVV